MKIDGIDIINLATYRQYIDQITQAALYGISGPQNTSDTGKVSNNDATTQPCQDIDSLLNSLQVGDNKYFILRSMDAQSVAGLIPLLDKDQLINAMNLFPKTKLVELIQYLPLDMLVKMLLWMLPIEELIQLFPIGILFNILSSDRLQVADIAATLQNLPETVLRNLLGTITNQPTQQMSSADMKPIFEKLDKRKLLDGMKTMPDRQIIAEITQTVKKDPQLMLAIPQDSYMKVINNMPKGSLVELFQVLPSSMLAQFVSLLPSDLLALAVSQLDDSTFSSILGSQFSGLVAALAAA